MTHCYHIWIVTVNDGLTTNQQSFIDDNWKKKNWEEMGERYSVHHFSTSSRRNVRL